MKKTKMEIEQSRRARCRYCLPSFDGKHYCIVNGTSDDKTKDVAEEECESCSRFDSRYIEYPLTINGIDNEEIDTDGLGHEPGCLCEIKPCGEEYNGKSYIGFYLGDLPVSIYSSFDRKTGILKNRTMNNPAIFVPELKKIIYGCESWWREIESADDFRGISDADIENTWYVQMLKQMNEENETENHTE